LDYEREIEGEQLHVIGRQPATRAVAHDAAENGSACISASAEQVHERFVQRLSLVSVALAKVNAHEYALALEATHRHRQALLRKVRADCASAKPPDVAASDSTTLSVTYSAARRY